MLATLHTKRVNGAENKDNARNGVNTHNDFTGGERHN